jgi:hypothetical protein
MDKSTQQVPEYEKPKVDDYGDLKDITAGTQNGNFTDANFPRGTPRGLITFSVNG